MIHIHNYTTIFYWYKYIYMYPIHVYKCTHTGAACIAHVRIVLHPLAQGGPGRQVGLPVTASRIRLTSLVSLLTYVRKQFYDSERSYTIRMLATMFCVHAWRLYNHMWLWVHYRSVVYYVWMTVKGSVVRRGYRVVKSLYVNMEMTKGKDSVGKWCRRKLQWRLMHCVNRTQMHTHARQWGELAVGTWLKLATMEIGT